MDQVIQGQWQFLEQAVYDDFEFISSQGIEFLLDQRWSEGGCKLVNLGLKIADYCLKPTNQFRNKYYQLHGGIISPKGMSLGQQIKNLRTTVCTTLKHILRNSLHLKSDFMEQNMTFFKNSETKSLCNDQMSVIWNRINFDLLLTKPAAISRELKRKGIGKFHLQERHRVITFEDLNEIQKEDFSYENQFMNVLQKDIDKYVSSAHWDQKKEKFVRHRLSCFVSQAAPEIAARQQNAAGSNKKEPALARQNTTLYYEKTTEDKNNLKLLLQMVKMIWYLPDMHEFFKYFPTQSVMREPDALLSTTVDPINCVSEGTEQEEKKQTAGQNEGVDNTDTTKTKLSEVSQLLPYLLCCLNFKVAQKTMKSFQKMMIYGDLSIRISLIDQMIYFIKELMLDSPEEHLVAQYLQTLTNMIKVWHQSEITKFQATDDVDIRPGHKYGNYIVFDLTSAGGQSLPIEANEDAANMYRELHRHLKIFDLLDMISLVSISNKDKFVRSLGTILSVETGKLKRLLVHKEK